MNVAPLHRTGTTIARAEPRPAIRDVDDPHRIAERTGLAPMDLDECWERLASQPLGRLAICVDGQPHLVPINHLVRDREIVFVSVAATTTHATLAQPGLTAVLEVDHYDTDTDTGWSVVVAGELAVVEDDVEHARLELYGRPSWISGRHQCRWLRLVPNHVEGLHLHPPKVADIDGVDVLRRGRHLRAPIAPRVTSRLQGMDRCAPVADMFAVQSGTLDVMDCLEHLAETHMGHVAVDLRDGPVVVDVRYLFEHGCVVLLVTAGVILEAAERRETVALHVRQFDAPHPAGWSVLVRGRLQEETGPEELDRLRDLDIAPAPRGATTHYVRVMSRSITGRLLPRDPWPVHRDTV